ncbi:hypothetical protein [Paenibacillus daejeonensis]|uniref:hypothetical protein n=1 Tax=Paenibacillus daejeonensis TaxID=135193 RepID=UPI0003625DFD|nr:hypothetical protein [Paenibacillus daejeonensis]
MTHSTIRIGIITSPEGKGVFQNVLQEFGGTEGRLIIYHRDEEIREMIEQHQQEVDVILFGGPLSYYMNKKYVREDMPALSIEYRETELLMGLLQLSLGSNQEIRGLSLDTFSQQTVHEVLAETGYPHLDTYVRPYRQEQSPEEIIAFHHALWEEGAIQHVLTCRRSVYNGLQELGVPTTKILPSLFNIRNSIAKAILMGENMQNTSSQIAIGHFQITPEATGGTAGDYSQEKLSLDFHRWLVDIAQRVNASILPLGGYEFLLYTNRGLLEELTRLWTQTMVIQELEQELSARVYAGFGAGRTALSAQHHAKSGLERAKEQPSGCAFLIRDDGKVIGPLGRSVTLEYSYKSQNPLLGEMAQRANLSMDTVTKLQSYSRIKGQFTADELASVLGVTTRNIRNIFKKLADAGYLHEVGMERPYPKGRPRKIYRLAQIEQQQI